MFKYKFIILSITTLLVGFLGGFFVAQTMQEANYKTPTQKKETPELIAQNTDVNEIKAPALLFFYGKNCSACHKFKPSWNVVKKKYKDKFQFLEIDVDEPQNAPLCYEFMINVIPSVFIEDAPFRNRSFMNPAEYHYMPRFEDELNRYIEMREILKRGISEK